MKQIIAYLRHLGLFSLAVCLSVSGARAQTATVTSERMMTVTLTGTKPQSLFGSLFATVTVGPTTATNSITHGVKETVSGNPAGPPTVQDFILMTPPTVVDGASAQATIDLTGSTSNASSHTIDIRQTNMVSISGNPAMASGLSRTRDPIPVGEDGFGGSPMGAGSSLSMSFDLPSPPSDPSGASFTSQEVIFPGFSDDPDSFFDPSGLSSLEKLDSIRTDSTVGILAPAGTEPFYTITADHTGPNLVVTFTPGSSASPNFTFSYDRSPSLIVAELTAAFSGMPYPHPLFTATAMLKMAENNVTVADQEMVPYSVAAAAAVPEPASVLLGLVGSGLLIVALGRQRKG